MTPRSLALAAVLLAAPLAVGADAGPAPVSLKVELISEEFDVHTDGLPLHKYEEKVRLAAREGDPLPSFGMEMVLVFKNESDHPVQMLVGGDETLLSLDLTGKAFLTLDAKVSRVPRQPSRVVVIPPRGVYRLTREDLSSGFRNKAKFTYLLGIGRYELTAAYQTAISPAPGGSPTAGREGFGQVIIKAEPVVFRTKKPS